MEQCVRLIEVVCTAIPTVKMLILKKETPYLNLCATGAVAPSYCHQSSNSEDDIFEQAQFWQILMLLPSYLISSSGPSLYLAPWALAILIPADRELRQKN